MDTGRGYFEPIAAEPTDTINYLERQIDNLKKRHPDAGGVFHVGEEVSLKGSRFKITNISKRSLILQLLER